jgi:DNA-binding Lrp family transcriptional regulator
MARDRLDSLDRRIMAALQISPRASWEQLASALGTSQTTVARRAQRLLQAGCLVIVGLPDPLRCGSGRPVLVQLRTTPGSARQVGTQLVRRGDARFVALITGRNDVICEIITPDRQYLTSVLLDEIQVLGGVVETTTETVLRTFKTSYDWSRELLGEEMVALQPRVADEAAPGAPGQDLDELDVSLIAALGTDGRRSYADLAGELGLSETSVARRMRALIASGCLCLATLVDPGLLGYEIEVFVRMRVEPSSLETVAAMLAGQPAVRYIAVTTGYSDLACEVVLRDTEAFYRFITASLGSLPGVGNVETDLELQTLKRGFRPPPQASMGSLDGSLPRLRRRGRPVRRA